MLILELIDQAIELAASKEAPFRNHLGGSMIGRPCERELVYQFRWSKRPQHQARILRLFERGHKEEFRFVEYLRGVGINVMAYSKQLFYHPGSDSYVLKEWGHNDQEIFAHCDDVTNDESHVKRAEGMGVKLSQWRISDVNGHFGGSLDGISIAPFDIQTVIHGKIIPANEPFINEFKTHNDKSFIKLVNSSVGLAKPQHYDQMQVYMHKKGLRFALYMAVNKNDDALYLEVVTYDEWHALDLLEKAERIVSALRLPARIGKHASFYECKFCDYKKNCHFGEPLDKSCRSCKHSQAVKNGQWMCHHWGQVIPTVDAIRAGCNNWDAIHD